MNDHDEEIRATLRQLEAVADSLLMYAAAPPGIGDGEYMEGRHVRALGEMIGEQARSIGRHLEALKRPGNIIEGGKA